MQILFVFFCLLDILSVYLLTVPVFLSFLTVVLLLFYCCFMVGLLLFGLGSFSIVVFGIILFGMDLLCIGLFGIG